MKKLKVIGGILGVAFAIFGFYGFTLPMMRSSSTTPCTFYSAKAINEVNGVTVDTNGKIYIGDDEGNYIQVFDSNGNFLYGFSFDTGKGWFDFGIDDNNIIHIVTSRNKGYFQYLNGELIHSELIDYERRFEIENTYNMSTRNSYKLNSTEYKITYFHNLKKYNSLSGITENVSIKVPVWPLPIYVYWLISAVGMGLIFWSFAWNFFKQKNIDYFVLRR